MKNVKLVIVLFFLCLHVRGACLTCVITISSRLMVTGDKGGTMLCRLFKAGIVFGKITIRVEWLRSTLLNVKIILQRSKIFENNE